jgi:hypothetical protein
MIPRKIFYLIGSLAVLFVFLFIYFDKKDTAYLSQNVSLEDEIDVQIKSSYNNRGTRFLNGGEIKLYGSYPVINQNELNYKIKEFDESSGRLWGKNVDEDEYLPVLKDIRPPYRLIKKAHSDTLKFVKLPDTILVHMRMKEPEYDPRDPTIGEFFQRIFSKKENKD